MKQIADSYLLQSGEVARRLGVSAQYVRMLDHALRPIRTARGTRLYDPAVVAAYVAQRAARQAAKSKPPAPAIRNSERSRG